MSEAITKAQPSAEFNGDWLLREVRFNAQGAVVDWRLARAAPSPQAPGRRKGPPGITLEPQGHEQPAVSVGDHPDTLRCIKARNDLNAALHGEGAIIDDLEHAVANACAKLRRPAVEPMTNEQQPNPFSKRCYTMSESHLSGYRLIVGFEHLEDAQDAHTFVANTGRHHGITAKAEGGRDGRST